MIQKKKQRLNLLQQFDNEIRSKGYPVLAGIDEAGRGPLAGPVIAAAVILPEQGGIEGVDDSKKLSENRRNELFEQIERYALAIGIGCVYEQDIDEINILQATYQAMKQAVAQLPITPDCLVIDAVRLPDCEYKQESIIKGDSKSYSIAVASIVAKVTRDRLMIKYDRKYPDYGFAKHKGYGTKSHYQALHHFGPCPIHRKTFLRSLQNIGTHS